MGWFSRKKDLDFCENYNASEDAEDFFAEAQKNAKAKSASPVAKHVLTADEVISGKDDRDTIPMSSEPEISPIEALRARVLKQAESKREEEIKIEQEKLEAEKKKATTNLLEKCTPFILDENGKADLNNEPTYILESIDSILGIKKKNAEKVNANSLKTLPKEEPKKEVKPEQKPTVQSETIVMERADFAKIPVLSDIDTPEQPTAEVANENDDVKDIYSTINFTRRFDLADDNSGKSTTTFTRITDLKSGISQNDASVQEAKILNDIFGAESAKEEFTPDFEYKSIRDAKSVGVKLKKEKRNAFFASVVSIVSILLSGLFCIPSIQTSFSENSGLYVGLQLAFLALSIAFNWGMFYNCVKEIAKKAITPDFALIITLTLGVVSAFTVLSTLSTFGYIVLLCCFLLASRSVLTFKKASYVVNNFRIIANSKNKHAVTLIDDRPTTFAMARNSIDGDVLAVAAKETTNVTDYVKNATRPMHFEGRFFILLIIFAVAAVLGGLSVGFTANSEIGLLTAFFLMALLVSPTAFACDIVPLANASKKLNKLGAMIAGKKAFNKIDAANACVLHSTDFFPRGTVTLHNIQVLSSNEIDETLLDAAAITSQLNSPLADIFADIAKTDSAKELPEADSVKYENQLGITGWVKDKRLFIGNRTLLEAHGIKLPGIEVDKKIMRQGFFPVYVASGQKACALLVIKYNVSERVLKEITKLCNLGVTLLVDNCDCNVSEQMLCDYFGIDPDYIKIMTDSGIHMYKSQVNYTKSSSAPAVFLKRSAVLPSILITAIKAKKAVSMWRVLHIVSTSLAALVILSIGVTHGEFNVNALHVVLFEIILLALSNFINLFYK